MESKTQLMWVIAGLGLVALVGVFKRMRGGFGSGENVRVFCATLSLIFAGLIAAVDVPYAFIGAGLVGVIVGYVVGRSRADNSLLITVQGAPASDLKQKMMKALSE
ncbi:MAG TPA: hypothetical protein VN282_09630 [Pyrinomonadaceae bacterium]|nr:hypothetical protein [Pyrinomonadaceae bacterium]